MTLTSSYPITDSTMATDLTGAVITAAGPGMRAVLHDLALPSFRRFADRWGYQVRAVDLPADGAAADPAAQRAKWMKLSLLRQALTEFELALWLDADVLVLRADEDIATHLRPGDFQALALEQVPQEYRVNPNTGVWLLRSCPMAFDFLDAVEAAGPQPGPWADQGAVLAALGWQRGDERYRGAKPGLGNHFLQHTSWLPLSWNQAYLENRIDADLYNGDARSYLDRPATSDPHAVHFMGMRPEARYRRMAELAGRQPTAVRASSAAIG
ncbi:MAG: hypothetical protein M3Y42_10145 [Actinomycetota bacterium]|nr:hypothetical protein [Actinomycetota bacterium]